MQISVQLGALQHNLDDLTTKFNRIEQTISLTKDNLEQTIYQVLLPPPLGQCHRPKPQAHPDS